MIRTGAVGRTCLVIAKLGHKGDPSLLKHPYVINSSAKHFPPTVVGPGFRVTTRDSAARHVRKLDQIVVAGINERDFLDLSGADLFS